MLTLLNSLIILLAILFYNFAAGVQHRRAMARFSRVFLIAIMTAFVAYFGHMTSAWLILCLNTVLIAITLFESDPSSSSFD